MEKLGDHYILIQLLPIYSGLPMNKKSFFIQQAIIIALHRFFKKISI